MIYYGVDDICLSGGPQLSNVPENYLFRQYNKKSVAIFFNLPCFNLTILNICFLPAEQYRLGGVLTSPFGSL